MGIIRLLRLLQHRNEISSLLTILPGCTATDGTLNVCLIQRSADRSHFVFIDGNSIYTAPVDSIEAIVYRVREVLMREQDTSPRGA